MPWRGIWNLITADGPGRAAAGVGFLALAVVVPLALAVVATRIVRG